MGTIKFKVSTKIYQVFIDENSIYIPVGNGRNICRLCESVGMICVTWLLVMLKMTGLDHQLVVELGKVTI